MPRANRGGYRMYAWTGVHGEGNQGVDAFSARRHWAWMNANAPAWRGRPELAAARSAAQTILLEMVANSAASWRGELLGQVRPGQARRLASNRQAGLLACRTYPYIPGIVQHSRARVGRIRFALRIQRHVWLECCIHALHRVRAMPGNAQGQRSHPLVECAFLFLHAPDSTGAFKLYSQNEGVSEQFYGRGPDRVSAGPPSGGKAGDDRRARYRPAH